MVELDEPTVRAHIRRRADAAPDPVAIDRLAAAVRAKVPHELQRRSLVPGVVALAPVRARLALAAAIVVAVSLVIVPLAGGPLLQLRSSMQPSSPTPSLDPTVFQVLTLDELQRVVAVGDTEPYVDQIVLADVDLGPGGPRQLTCLIEDCPIGLLVEGAPGIRVIQPFEDTDILPGRIGENGVSGPVILRIRRANTVELIGEAPTAAGRAAWPLPSFVQAVRDYLRTMDFAPTSFLVGPPYVVEAKLLQGQPVPCPTAAAASPARLGEFGCGLTAWLAPTVVADPTTIIDTSDGRPPDWVRVQNGMYRRFGMEPADGPGATPNWDPRRGFYLVFPLVRYDARICFDCDAGAVAILYAKLEPVPIP